MFPAQIGRSTAVGKREAEGEAEGADFLSSLRDLHHSWNRWVISLISLPSSDETEEASESDSELSDVSPFLEGGLLVSLTFRQCRNPTNVWHILINCLFLH